MSKLANDIKSNWFSVFVLVTVVISTLFMAYQVGVIRQQTEYTLIYTLNRSEQCDVIQAINTDEVILNQLKATNVDSLDSTEMIAYKANLDSIINRAIARKPKIDSLNAYFKRVKHDIDR